MILQKKINLDKEFKACDYVRAEIPQRITNINFLLKKIKQLKLYKAENQDINDFALFIENLANEKHGSQRNNHNYMYTFLKEKVDTYKRIKYDELQESISRGKLPYAKNLSPATIMSNYYLSNETENMLYVDKLETSFRIFIRGERGHLSSKDKFINLGPMNVVSPTGQQVSIKEAFFKVNNDKLYEEEIDDIKNYFALQLTRREFFLYDVLKKCIKNKDLESLDLLDYMTCKYIYNKSLKENFNNWLTHIGNGDIEICQVQYKESTLGFTHKEALNIKTMPGEKDSVFSNMAITESHTFFVSELINSINLSHLNGTLTLNGMEEFSLEEIEKTNKLLVTLGSASKLCYLMIGSISKKLFDKINFVIHYFWDECMVHQVLLNLLLKKDSKLNNIEYFKDAKISEETLARAKFMRSMFQLSEKYEKEIKKV